MNKEHRQGNVKSFWSRLCSGVMLIISVLAIVSVVIMVNYLSARHFKRYDITSSKQWKLSPYTLKFLNSLTNDVKVIVYFDKEHPAYDLTVSLLREYSARSPAIKLQIINPTTNPVDAERIKTNYRLVGPEGKDVIIFDYNGQVKIVYSNEIIDYELEPVENSAGNVFRKKVIGFKGESYFTSALIWVTQPRQLKAYYVQDHREHSLSSRDEIVGYSRFADLLSEIKLKPEPLSLLGSAEIPTDCSLLIIAAPLEPYTSDEIDKIERYLNQGGRLLVLVNNNTVKKVIGIEKMLIGWGVIVGDNIVLDMSRQLPGSRGLALSLNRFAPHPITEPLENSAVHLLMPRTVSAIKSASKQPDSPKVTELIFTSEQGIVADDIRDGTVQLNPARIYRGNFPVAAAIEKGSVRGVVRGSTRIVVIGDSFLFGNQMIDTAGNRDFAMLTVNWLVDRTELMGGIGPRVVKEYKLLLTQQQLNTLRIVLMLVLPGSVLFIGFIVWTMRRK
ncbi:MAG: GldG family protein [Verrucomicrobiia bacterium]